MSPDRRRPRARWSGRRPGGRRSRSGRAGAPADRGGRSGGGRCRPPRPRPRSPPARASDPAASCSRVNSAQVHRRADRRARRRGASSSSMSSSSVRAWSAARPATRWSRLALASPPGSLPDPPLHDHRAVRDGRARQLDDRVGEPGGPLARRPPRPPPPPRRRGRPTRLRSEREGTPRTPRPPVRGDEVVDDPVGPAGSRQRREDDGHDHREEDDHEHARAPVAPQVRRRDQRCRSHREIIGRHRASRQPGDHVVEPSCYHPGGRPGYGAAVFSQTETCDRQSPVKGSRFHPPQRSRRVIPASRAIRSSSPGHTYRKGSEKISSSPSTTR